ncbi:MAG: class I fructose-bisphosphate aldolase [Anaerolineae bacterium]|nr:aldolase [Anaerolineales bacterium]MCQ3977525.1 aldolase [Anaerolineae bacterium]
MSVQPRLKRLLGPDGKCFDVAIDHGIFGEPGFLAGIENMKTAVETIVAANPDAVQLSRGQAHLLQEIPGKQKPALVLRTDTTNVYGRTLPRYLFSHLMENAVEQALVLDAVAVVVNLLLLPEQPELYHQSIAHISKLKPVCERYGMPLMIEPLVMQPNDRAGGYMVDGNLEKIITLVRQAVELGADIIKADPCDDAQEYHKVIETASGIPVLVRGGGRVSDEEVLERTLALMKQGAAGIVYGRNVIQHARPDRMTQALMAIVHEDADVATAAAILRGS